MAKKKSKLEETINLATESMFDNLKSAAGKVKIAEVVEASKAKALAAGPKKYAQGVCRSLFEHAGKSIADNEDEFNECKTQVESSLGANWKSGINRVDPAAFGDETLASRMTDLSKKNYMEKVRKKILESA